MSIDRCANCGDLVDTDAEPEAYVEIGNMRAQIETRCLCRDCREACMNEMENRRAEPPGLDAFIEQQIAADPRRTCKDCDWDVDGCSPCEEHQD